MLAVRAHSLWDDIPAQPGKNAMINSKANRMRGGVTPARKEKLV
jgi:hypothetical protein